MSFGQAVSTCFKKYGDFSGEAARPEFWWWYLFTALVIGIPASIGAIIMIAGAPMADTSDPNMTLVTVGGFILGLSFLGAFAVFVPTLAVMARRLRDGGFSPWLLLLELIPFGGVALFVLWLLPSAASKSVPAQSVV